MTKEKGFLLICIRLGVDRGLLFTLGREMAVPAFCLPKVEGFTHVLVYFGRTLGRKMAVPAL